MTKPAEEDASTLEAFRVFDGEDIGVIDSKAIRESMVKSLEQIDRNEIHDMLECLGLIDNRTISFEGIHKFLTIIIFIVGNFHLSRSKMNKLKYWQ